MTRRTKMRPTLEEVLAQGPLDRATARKWGIKFPLKTGWKDRLIRQIVVEEARQTRRYRAQLSPKDATRFDELRQAIAEAEDLLAQAQAVLDNANRELAEFIRNGTSSSNGRIAHAV